ncbi:MAG: hypothetical protein ACJA0Z_003352 [Halioglobus sp.]|jgi:hypothetical protein
MLGVSSALMELAMLAVEHAHPPVVSELHVSLTRQGH